MGRQVIGVDRRLVKFILGYRFGMPKFNVLLEYLFKVLELPFSLQRLLILLETAMGSRARGPQGRRVGDTRELYLTTSTWHDSIGVLERSDCGLLVESVRRIQIWNLVLVRKALERLIQRVWRSMYVHDGVAYDGLRNGSQEGPAKKGRFGDDFPTFANNSQTFL